VATAGSILNLLKSFLWARVPVPGGCAQELSRAAEFAGPSARWPKSSIRGDITKGFNEVCEKRLEFSHVLLASTSSFKVCSAQLSFESGAMTLKVLKDFRAGESSISRSLIDGIVSLSRSAS